MQRLRSFLAGGGVLVADAAAGNKAFDAAFRREMKRVLTATLELTVLPPDSPVYQTPYAIGAVEYTPLVQAQAGKVTAPLLEGITIGGQLAVIYSPLGLSNGWEQSPTPSIAATPTPTPSAWGSTSWPTP